MNLRRYQRRLLFGGGLLSTLIALVILGLGVSVGVNAQMEAQRRAFSLGHAMVAKFGRGALVEPARVAGMRGMAVIINTSGHVIDLVGDCCAERYGPSRATLRRLAELSGDRLKSWHEPGLFLISQRLNENTVLVYAYALSSIAEAVGEDVIVDFMLTLPTLSMMWLLLISLKMRVFRPLLEWSRRVYEGEELNRILIDTAPVGLGLISLDSGKVLVRSPAMAHIAARIGTGAHALPATCIKLHKAHVARGTGSPRHGTFSEDVRFETLDRIGLDLSICMVRARYQGQEVLVTTFTDVTSKSRVERQMRKARQASDKANAAKSAFLAAMSHEIRTPLNAILGNLELLSHSKLNAAQRDRLCTIRAASDGLLAIISDVLDFSKIEAGELQLESVNFNVLDVASHALRMFEPAARRRGLTLSCDFGPSSSIPMCGDPTRLGQIVNNLLSNAVKFTEQGAVTLTLSVDAGREALFLQVHDTGIGMSPDQTARLFRAFSQADPTINRRFGGTGLGLALCSRLAQAMGGALSAQSEPGRGSRFTLRLPLGDRSDNRRAPRFDGQRVALLAASASARSDLGGILQSWGLNVHSYAHPSLLTAESLGDVAAVVLWGDRRAWRAEDENRLVEQAPRVILCSEDGPLEPVTMGRTVRVSTLGVKGLEKGLMHVLLASPLREPELRLPALASRLRVLVVEDNMVNRQLFTEQLELLGCDPVSAESGPLALQFLQREKYDVLLTDLAMPDIDGYTLAQSVRKHWPDVPIIAASAHITPEIQRRCEEAGMAIVLSKPLSLDRLAHALTAVTGVRNLRMEVNQPGSFLGGRALGKDLERTFRQACEASLNEISQSRIAGDLPQLLAYLHKLRGMLDVFGAHRLSRLAVKAETHLQAGGGLIDARDLLDALEVGLARASSQ
ncbi:hybrid sensor histidine kinase/response regulator [Achromobacter sp. JUb104]|uniref:hybrid sensor histidine kinase/response regulator n=1 Tax=Achromobacter sp. JUb104 TaxID=2940590 RepID=UPI0021679189|nr:hybrid sensor histidine kinase/response regulator [Achromobacter sp. JUb104]MCS3509249.1 two-component system capsular synthesis sensor histidine kinase RcsC [Achromobacter sp. JUb104]